MNKRMYTRKMLTVAVVSAVMSCPVAFAQNAEPAKALQPAQENAKVAMATAGQKQGPLMVTANKAEENRPLQPIDAP